MNIVKELRQRKGIQQKELAADIGVSYPTVSEWEHQKKDPSGQRLQRLSDYFGVPVGVILGYDDISHRKPTKDEIRFALFDGDEGITDEDFEEVKRYARYIKARKSL